MGITRLRDVTRRVTMPDMKDIPIKYMVRLGKRHRRILATYVRGEERKGRRDCYEAEAVRKAIDLLEKQMAEEKKWVAVA